MSNSIYDTAIKVWIARKISSGFFTGGYFQAEHILEFNFGAVHDFGGCETCGWDETYPVINYKVKTSQKEYWDKISLANIPIARVLEECMEIYRTLSRLPEYSVL